MDEQLEEELRLHWRRVEECREDNARADAAMEEAQQEDARRQQVSDSGNEWPSERQVSNEKAVPIPEEMRRELAEMLNLIELSCVNQASGKAGAWMKRIAALTAEVATLKEHVAAQSWPERFACWQALGFPQGHEGNLVEAIAALKAKSDRLAAPFENRDVYRFALMLTAMRDGLQAPSLEEIAAAMTALILARAILPQDAGGTNG